MGEDMGIYIYAHAETVRGDGRRQAAGSKDLDGHVRITYKAYTRMRTTQISAESNVVQGV